MTVISLATGERLDLLPKGCAVALGFFDGVHLGHRAILSAAKKEAARLGHSSAVWMIGRAAGSSYKGKGGFLTEEQEKLSLIAACGIDYAVISPFEDIRDMSGEQFVREVLCDTLGARACVCGFNFRFGKGAAFGTGELAEYCSSLGMSQITVDAVNLDGESVSSTRIRQAVADGDMETAARLLGRPYSFTLPVLCGKALGRRLGFPTANQLPPAYRALPPRGVYAAEAVLEVNGGEVSFPACSNIGSCPTVTDSVKRELSLDGNAEAAADEGRIVLETYIDGFSGDIYGRELKVSLLKKLRCEKRFSGTDELTHQIACDIDSARSVFDSYRKEE